MTPDCWIVRRSNQRRLISSDEADTRTFCLNNGLEAAKAQAIYCTEQQPLAHVSPR